MIIECKNLARFFAEFIPVTFISWSYLMSFGLHSNMQVKVLYAYHRSSRISKPDDTHPVHIESQKGQDSSGQFRNFDFIGRASAAHLKLASFTLSDLDRVSQKGSNTSRCLYGR